MIDVTDASLTCQSVNSFPFTMAYSVGGLLANHVPIVCGGWNGSSSSEDCYTLDKDSGFQVSQRKLLTPRRYASAVPIKGGTVLFVTGGYNVGDIKTTEYVSPESDTVYGPDLPFTLQDHCIVAINESTLIITGGESHESIQTTYSSWYFDVSKETWIEGPRMKHYHRFHSCAVFTGPSGQKVVAISSGMGEATTQLLFMDQPDEWNDGNG